MNDMPEVWIAAALEKIAEALTRLAIMSEERFKRDFPIKPEPHDATVTRIKTDEDRIREEHGASDEPIEKWLTLGSREQEIIAKGSKRED